MRKKYFIIFSVVLFTLINCAFAYSDNFKYMFSIPFILLLLRIIVIVLLIIFLIKKINE